MQEAALDPNYESLSWSDSDDYDQYVNEELEDSRSAKWVGLVSRLAGCSLEGKTVLDLGCGPGFFPCALGAEGAKVYGIDTSDNMLACARANAEKHGVDAVMLHMDAESLSFPEATFDLVVTRNVTWTLPNPVAAYRECLKVLRPRAESCSYSMQIGTTSSTAKLLQQKVQRKRSGVLPENRHAHGRVH